MAWAYLNTGNKSFSAAYSTIMPEKHTMGVSGVPTDQWHVLGAGAMGCLWAAALQRHQHSAGGGAVLLLRDTEALTHYPGMITLESAGSKIRQFNVPALAVTALPDDRPLIQNLLLACKAQDTEAALDSLSPWLNETSRIVLLQNGIRVQQELTLRRAPGTVFCLSTSHGAWTRRPFHVVHAGMGNAWLGLLGTAPPVETRQSLASMLNQLPGSEMNISADLQMSQRLWLKFAVNCAINPMTVVYNCQNGFLLSNDLAREHLQQLCLEISVLTNALPECPSLPDIWEQVKQVAQATQNNYSSTLQDIRNHKTTEIEHLNGWLCELASRHQLACPLNQQLLQAVRERQSLRI
jgi:2-dehydropantoate 2-reductase